MWNSILLIKYLNNNWRAQNAIRPKMNHHFCFTFTFRTFYLDTISSPDNIILINSHCQTNARSTCCFFPKVQCRSRVGIYWNEKSYLFFHSFNESIYLLNELILWIEIQPLPERTRKSYLVDALYYAALLIKYLLKTLNMNYLKFQICINNIVVKLEYPSK